MAGSGQALAAVGGIASFVFLSFGKIQWLGVPRDCLPRPTWTEPSGHNKTTRVLPPKQLLQQYKISRYSRADSPHLVAYLDSF